MPCLSVICISASFTVLSNVEMPKTLITVMEARNIHSSIFWFSFTAYDGKVPSRPSVPQENSSPRHYSLKPQPEQPVITHVSISSQLLILASDWITVQNSGCQCYIRTLLFEKIYIFCLNIIYSMPEHMHYPTGPVFGWTCLQTIDK